MKVIQLCKHPSNTDPSSKLVVTSGPGIYQTRDGFLVCLGDGLCFSGAIYDADRGAICTGLICTSEERMTSHTKEGEAVMTTKEAVRGLKNGDRVHWIENDEIAPEIGVANQDKSRIEWPDGQVTLFTDDWAMAHVHRGFPGLTLPHTEKPAKEQA